MEQTTEKGVHDPEKTDTKKQKKIIKIANPRNWKLDWIKKRNKDDFVS